jgi:hypothetical protein
MENYVIWLTAGGRQFAVLYRPNSSELPNTALNSYISCISFIHSNNNYGTKESFMCHSVPVSLCALINPLHDSIRYCNAMKQTPNQALAWTQTM